MILLSPPLKDLYMTQGFGVNLAGAGFYDHNPSKLHSGWDMRAPLGTPILAGEDGMVEKGVDGAGGHYMNLFVEVGDGRRLCLHHNHCSETSTGKVKRGDQIGLTGNTGLSNGPHLHYGTRMFDEKGVINYDNGYRGYFDPKEFFPRSIWYRVGREFKLPVDDEYGGEDPKMTVLEWYKANRWIWKTYRRLMTDREMKALRFGYWGIKEVLDPGMFHEWSRKTKPAWLKEQGKL